MASVNEKIIKFLKYMIQIGYKDDPRIKNILYRSLFKNSIYYREEYREMFEKYIEDIV